jgi:vacuolar-type H+-ATPase subunit C/Vma6
MNDALNARAKGLGTRLLSREQLERLAMAGDVSALGRLLARADKGLTPAPLGPALADLEQAVRRGAAKAFCALARWGEPLEAVLEVFFAELDRKSLRALLRGAVQGASPQARLHALIPTPALPERALKELARLPVTGIAGQLVLLNVPEAQALQRFAKQAHPPLFEVELALLKAWAGRARRAARRGDENLRAFVAEQIDGAMMRMALLLASGPLDTDVPGCFVEGGRWLTLEAFTAAAKSGSRASAAAAVDRALARTPLAGLAKQRLDDPARMEQAALARALDVQHSASLMDPLGSAPVLLFLLRLTAQSLDLLRIAHGTALGAPPSLLNAELVTPWS